MNADDWLEARLGRPRSGETILVLCRSRATVTRVRRWMAEKGGWIGADVVTPHGLVASLDRPALGEPRPEASGPMPADNPITALIGARPGLVAAARRWVRRAREWSVVGHGLDGTPAWLAGLAEGDWADDGTASSLAEALERLRADPKHPTESHHYDRILLLGFEAGRALLEPAATAVAVAMSGGPLPEESAPSRDRAIPFTAVQDAVAEVRLAASLAAARPTDTLVLVTEDSTARRLRDALARNGVACSFTDPPPAAASALGGLVLRMVPWFAQENAPLRVLDVAWVFGHRALTGALSPAAQRALDGEREAQELPEKAVRPSRRVLAETLRETRVLDAPLSRWITRLEAVAFDAERPERIRGAALALRVRLQLLRARVAGVDPEQALGSEEGPTWDDFDNLVAELLGDEAADLVERPEAQSLGAVKAFLTDLRPRVHDDAAARAVLGALKERRASRAEPATAREALGSPVDPGALGTGIDVLHYDDWDGRPAGQLLLLDVHHKGLSRRPTPDPLLDEPAQRALGLPAGQDLVDFRVSQLLRAVERADSVLALVAGRDAGGRDLVPPIQLRLEADPRLDPGSYGLGADLPERARAHALVVRHDGVPETPSATSLGALCTQANLEWYRAGRGPLPPVEPPRAVDRYASLDERLDALRPIAPEFLLPWLGHAEGVPEAALPDRPWSASRLFEPLSRCAWQAFARAVLRVERQEEIPEDLDPREIGKAIHDALEALGAGLRLRVPRDRLDQARSETVDALREETRRQLDRLAGDLAGLSEARTEAVRGRIQRWNAHWPSWASSRIQEGSAADWRTKKDFVRGHPKTHHAARVMQDEVPGAAGYPLETLEKWLTETVEDAHRGTDPARMSDGRLARHDQRWGGLDAGMANGLRAFLEHEAFAGVQRARKSAEIRGQGGAAEILATAVELPFGRPDDPPGQLIDRQGAVREVDLGEIRVRLGGDDLALTGRIDRVVASYYKGRPLFEIIDYKTSRSAPDSAWKLQKELHSGRQPQLMIYALALREAERLGRLGPGLERGLISAVGWDFVRHTEKDPPHGQREATGNEVGRFLVDNVVLDHVAERIGALVDEGRAGRWTLLPRPDVCPAVKSWGTFCDVQHACRLTGLPPVDEEPSR